MIRVKQLVALGAMAASASLGIAGSAGAVVVGGSVTPQGGTFTDGQTITVSGGPGTVAASSQVIVSLCANTNSGVAFDPFNDCDFLSAANFADPANADGSFSDFFTIIDPAGFDCTAALPCRLRINTGIFADVGDQAFIPGFVVGAPVVTTTTTAPTTTTTAPDPVVPEVPLNVLIPLGGAAAMGGAYFLVRRGRTA